MGPALHVVGNVLYYSFDAAGKLTKDFDAATNAAKIVNIGIQYINMDLKNSERVLQPLFRTIKVVADCASIRNWVSKVVFLASGQAAGANAATQIFLAPTVSIPNFLKISSISCFLASDILGSLRWLDNLEIINLAKLTETIGNLPVLGGLIAGLTLQEVLGSFVVIGLILDLADTTRDICQNGLTWYNGVQVVSDIAKLTGIVLATASGQLYVIGLVASGTGCACFIARFVMRTYKVGF